MMQCRSHSENEVVGYCIVCGELGCNECFTIFEGEFYCRKDFKNLKKAAGREFKSVAAGIEEQKERDKALRRPDRQRLVIHRTTGDLIFAVCFFMNLESTGFYADLCDLSGKLTDQRVFIAFNELKAVYYVKSFDGRFDRRHEYHEFRADGSPVVVRFKDGETMEGTMQGVYRPDKPRFFIVPRDPESNNISVLIEASAVDRVFSPEEFRQRVGEDLQSYVEKHVALGTSPAEAEGNFHFHRRDYHRSAHAYEKALLEAPNDEDLIKKCAVSLYNIGAMHIHKHEYRQAMIYVQKAHELQPEDNRIHEKLQQLRTAIAKLEEKRAKQLARKQAEQ